MGKLHLLILKCEKGHAFGGTVYMTDRGGLSDAIGRLKTVGEKMGLDKAYCPFCKSEEFHFHDEETPFDSTRDDGVAEYINSAKKRQMNEVDSNIVLMTGTTKEITVITDGETQKVKLFVPTGIHTADEVRDA